MRLRLHVMAFSFLNQMKKMLDCWQLHPPLPQLTVPPAPSVSGQAAVAFPLFYSLTSTPSWGISHNRSGAALQQRR